MSTLVSVVTGGASGVGKALCADISAAGGEVFMLDAAADRGSAAAEETGVAFIRCNVALREDWRAAAAAIRAAGDAPTFVALNAGVMTRPPAAPIVDNVFDWIENGGYERVMRVNVDGVVFGLEALVPLMSQGGAIVVTCSLAGLSPLPFDPFYAASKHAIVGLVRSFASVLSPRNIRINAFCPGGVATTLVPAQIVAASPPMMTADEAARAILSIAATPETGGTYVKTGPGGSLTRYEPPQPALS